MVTVSDHKGQCEGTSTSQKPEIKRNLVHRTCFLCAEAEVQKKIPNQNAVNSFLKLEVLQFLADKRNSENNDKEEKRKEDKRKDVSALVCSRP